MKIIITQHAKERLIERGGIMLKLIAEDAYQNGENLTDEEMRIMFEKGIFGKRYWGSTYRKHFGLIWVFRNKSKKIRLLTVLYPRFLRSPFEKDSYFEA